MRQHRVVLLDRGELAHTVGRNEQRIPTMLLVDVDADLGRARDELGILAMLRLDRAELVERRRSEEGLPTASYVATLGTALQERLLERRSWKRSSPGGEGAQRAFFFSCERIEHRVADRSIAGAATQGCR